MPGQVELVARFEQGILFEDYTYGPGPAGELPRHAHAEYQLTLSLGAPGEYLIRGSRIAVPAGSLTVIGPGEAHGVRDPGPIRLPGRFLVAYVPEAQVREAARELAPSRSGAAWLGEPVNRDPRLLAAAIELHRASGDRDPLRLEIALAEMLGGLLAESGGATDPQRPSTRGVRRAVARARALIEERYIDGIGLAELAEQVGLSRFHLSREFAAAVGVPPHRYAVNLRVDHARRLLAAGEPIASAAVAAGFADQSHLNRHFARLAGLTPGSYASTRRKNIQESAAVAA